MDRKSRESVHRGAFWIGIVACTAYAGCVGDPPKRLGAGDGGSSGTSEAPGGSNGSGASGGGKGGKGGQNQGGSAGTSGASGNGSGGTENAGGADGVEGGAPGSIGGEGGGPSAECADGLVACPGSAECTDLDVGHKSGKTVSDCGECGVSCSLDHATSSTCSSGTCEPVCSPGFDDCNAGTANDGCETNLASPAACGACGRACGKTGVATAACTDSKCTPACAAGFLDCNPDDGDGSDDGCELYGDSLTACGATCESSGSPCTGTEVCHAGTCGDPQGLVVFTIPFTASGQVQRYGNRFTPIPNLTNSALVMRVYAPGALSGSLFLYPTDGTASSQGPGVTVPLSTLSAGWVDVELPIAGANGEFDPVTVFQLTIEISSAGAGPWEEPTVVYVDSVWSKNALVKDTFDANIGQMVTSSLLKVEGSSLGWVDALPPPPTP